MLLDRELFVFRNNLTSNWFLWKLATQNNEKTIGIIYNSQARRVMRGQYS